MDALSQFLEKKWIWSLCNRNFKRKIIKVWVFFGKIAWEKVKKFKRKWLNSTATKKMKNLKINFLQHTLHYVSFAFLPATTSCLVILVFWLIKRVEYRWPWSWWKIYRTYGINIRIFIFRVFFREVSNLRISNFFCKKKTVSFSISV